jgi:nucleoside 2-deoxyribosyltransferase
MRIFLICPVRNVTPAFEADILAQVAHLRNEGHLVYYPAQDTNQTITARRIAQINRDAMEGADAVWVAWDGESQGVLFDLGMAFAMGKPLYVATGMMPPMTTSKSFQNLCYGWEEAGI